MKKKKPGPLKGKKHSEIKRSEFGTRLFRARKARSLTQTELGKKIGVTKRVIAFYEGDNAGPSIDLLKKIAAALNVTTSYLVGESPQKIIKDDIRPSLKKHIEKLQKLPPKDQKSIITMIDALELKNKVEVKNKK